MYRITLVFINVVVSMLINSSSSSWKVVLFCFINPDILSNTVDAAFFPQSNINRRIYISNSSSSDQRNKNHHELNNNFSNLHQHINNNDSLTLHHPKSYSSMSMLQLWRAGGVTSHGMNRKKKLSALSLSSSSSSCTHNSNDLQAPNVKKIISFAIPAIGIWLCGPLLSLIDTSAVGLLSGTAQQAALNPAITITEDGALLVSFMYTATTNLVASAFENDRNKADKSQTISTVITSLQLGLIVGIIFGIGLGSSATFLIRSLIGKGGQELNNEVLSAATKYVRIRALGMPAAVVIGAAQSACLGMKDIRSPLIVMIVAAFVNFLGDIIFVGKSGAAGAAMATTISQYVALIMFLKWLNMNAEMDETRDNELKNGKEHFSTRGVLNGHFEYIDLLKFPSVYKTVKKFLQYVIPVTTTAVGRVSGYIAMSHVVSSALGTVDLAAQQIVLAFFLCFIPMCDSLNLTAQSFVPGIFEYKKDASLRSTVLKQTVKNFLQAGSIFGLILMAVVSCIPLVSKFFSHDLNVIQSVNSTTLYISIYALLSGVVCAGEGLLLGQKDLKFLSNSFTAFFFIVPYILLRVKYAALRGVQGIGIASIWRVFTVYQAIRCALWLVRLRHLSNRLDREQLLQT